MSMVDFSKLLAKKADDVKPPIDLPSGTYEGIISKHELKESAKGLGYINYTIRLTGAKDDVDPADLEGIDLTQKNMFKSYFFEQGGLDWSARSEVDLLDLIKSCGVKTEGRGIGELISEIMNAQVILEITSRPNPKDPEKSFVEVGKVQGA